MKDLRIGKYRLDISYVVALLVGVILLFALPDNKQDVVALLTVVAGFLVVDILINWKDKEEYNE